MIHGTMQRSVLIYAGLVALILPGLIGSSNVRQSRMAVNNYSAAMAEQPHPAGVNQVDSRLITTNIKFGLKLYGEVVKENTGQNIFVSPSSVAMTLAMAYNGAEGETRKAMARVLGIQEMKLDEVNRAFADLKSVLTNPDSNVRLQIANSLWLRRGITFQPNFVQYNNTFYGAEVMDLDFNDPAAPSTINAWVSHNTNEKIGKIIDQKLF